MCNTGRGAADLMIGGKLFRKLDARSWEVKRRLEDMDKDGVSAQVLSPMPELLSYWFEGDDGEGLADYMNGYIAGMIAQAPTRFHGLGMVPLQDVPRAVATLRRIKENFGLCGVQIGTHVDGVMLGDATLSPFWEAACDMGMAVFVHPLHPLTQRHLDMPPLFHPLVGFPLDIAVAGSSMLMAGLLERHPNLRIGLSHGGGAMMPVVHRLDQAWDVMETARKLFKERPSLTAAKFFYDSNVYDARYLAACELILSPGRVCMGTDYPYEIMQTAPGDYLARVKLAPAEIDSIAFRAAEAFLGL
jgi:aminocarboxymuconate-semialdehyde decarboxylase